MVSSFINLKIKELNTYQSAKSYADRQTQPPANNIDTLNYKTDCVKKAAIIGTIAGTSCKIICDAKIENKGFLKAIDSQFTPLIADLEKTFTSFSRIFSKAETKTHVLKQYGKCFAEGFLTPLRLIRGAILSIPMPVGIPAVLIYSGATIKSMLDNSKTPNNN